MGPQGISSAVIRARISVFAVFDLPRTAYRIFQIATKPFTFRLRWFRRCVVPFAMPTRIAFATSWARKDNTKKA